MALTRTRPVTTVLCVLLITGCAASGELDPPLAEAPPPAEAENPLAGAFYWSPPKGLFYEWQFEDEPFDRSSVADLIGTLETSEDELQRRLAAYELGECCFGGSFRRMRYIWPSREQSKAMISAVQQGRTGTKARVLVPVLMKALDDPSRDVREAVARSFVRIGPVGAEAAPRLRAALGDEDAVVRLWVARALHGMTLEVDAPLNATLAALGDQRSNVREMAVYSLDLMGSDARSALGRLQQIAKSDPSEGVREQARQAIDGIGR